MTPSCCTYLVRRPTGEQARLPSRHVKAALSPGTTPFLLVRGGYGGDVERLLGVPALVMAYVLIVHNETLAVWQNRDVQRRTGGHFAHDDWRTWNRIIGYVVGFCFAVSGVALVLGAPLST